MIIVTRNRGGTYILCDLDGTVAHSPIAAFCLVPYFPCREIDTLNICLDDYLDVPDDRIRELEQTTSADPDDPEVAESLTIPNPAPIPEISPTPTRRKRLAALSREEIPHGHGTFLIPLAFFLISFRFGLHHSCGSCTLAFTALGAPPFPVGTGRIEICDASFLA